MRLRLFRASEFARKLKATIQASGRLGFTEVTSHCLGIDETRGIKFARDEIGNLYLAVCLELSEECFPVKASSGYYYVFAANLFDSFNIDYKSQTVVFDLAREQTCDEFFHGKAFKMNQRI